MSAGCRCRWAGPHLWSVFFLVPTGRANGLRALSAAAAEDVLN